MSAIRLSPSGPIITGPGGAPLVPGVGMQLRLVQAQATVSAVTLIPTSPAAPVGLGPSPGVVVLLLPMANPNPGANYKATVTCDVSNTGTVDSEVQLYIDTSVDDGVSWTPAVSNSHFVKGGGASPSGSRQIRCDMIMTAGVDLDVTSAPPTPSLVMRARIGSTGANVNAICRIDSQVTPGGENSVGTILLEFAELL